MHKSGDAFPRPFQKAKTSLAEFVHIDKYGMKRRPDVVRNQVEILKESQCSRHFRISSWRFNKRLDGPAAIS